MEFDSLLKLMSEKSASDLFITVGMAPCIKVNGRIVPVSKEKITLPGAHGFVGQDIEPEARVV